MTDKEQIIVDGKIIGCPCYIDRPLHRYHKGCLVQSQAFKEQQTEEKPILRCDEIKNCPIKENFKQLQCKTQECESLKEEIEVLKDNFDTATRDCNELIEELKQECEELSNKIKNEIQNTVEMERLARSHGQDLMIYKQNKDIEVNSLKDDVIFYLKLIKKIEIYCDEQNLKYDTTACEILNIINKAKDGE